jgi:hypothetical protein
MVWLLVLYVGFVLNVSETKLAMNAQKCQPTRDCEDNTDLMDRELDNSWTDNNLDRDIHKVDRLHDSFPTNFDVKKRMAPKFSSEANTDPAKAKIDQQGQDGRPCQQEQSNPDQRQTIQDGHHWANLSIIYVMHFSLLCFAMRRSYGHVCVYDTLTISSGSMSWARLHNVLNIFLCGKGQNTHLPLGYLEDIVLMLMIHPAITLLTSPGTMTPFYILLMSLSTLFTFNWISPSLSLNFILLWIVCSICLPLRPRTPYSPWIASIRFAREYNPNPVPPVNRCVCLKGRNNVSMSSGCTPMPLSSTSKSK